MEEKIERMFSRKLSIRQCQDPGEPIAWGVFYGDRLIGSHKTARAARFALEDAEELRGAFYDVLFMED